MGEVVLGVPYSWLRQLSAQFPNTIVVEPSQMYKIQGKNMFTGCTVVSMETFSDAERTVELISLYLLDTGNAYLLPAS